MAYISNKVYLTVHVLPATSFLTTKQQEIFPQLLVVVGYFYYLSKLSLIHWQKQMMIIWAIVI